MIQLGFNFFGIKKARIYGQNKEQVMGIEPTCSAWKADILPLNYTRIYNAL